MDIGGYFGGWAARDVPSPPFDQTPAPLLTVDRRRISGSTKACTDSTPRTALLLKLKIGEHNFYQPFDQGGDEECFYKRG